MKKRIKRACTVLFIGLFGFTLSGCMKVGEIKDAIERALSNDSAAITVNGAEYEDSYEYAIYAVEELMACIDDGDKDGVKALLCSALKNDENIDEYVDTLVDGFEGDIVSTTLYKRFQTPNSSCGEGYNSAFMNTEFYITTDETVYKVYIALCPIDEKHDDGEDIVGIYEIQIETLDYASEDRERPEFDIVEVAEHVCYVKGFYGESSGYLPVQSGMNQDFIILYRILPDSGEGGSYEDILNWTSRDAEAFKEAFGEPYAECVSNDMTSYGTDGYLYKLTDSEKYAAVTVYKDSGEINTLRIWDINRYRNDEEDDVILDHEE